VRRGGKWRGADGTDYDVVLPLDVAPNQPRWWIDVPPEPGDRMLGPSSPARLHTYSLAQCELGTTARPVSYALVLLT
jgi:hypothetical protein